MGVEIHCLTLLRRLSLYCSLHAVSLRTQWSRCCLGLRGGLSIYNLTGHHKRHAGFHGRSGFEISNSRCTTPLCKYYRCSRSAVVLLDFRATRWFRIMRREMIGKVGHQTDISWFFSNLMQPPSLTLVLLEYTQRVENHGADGYHERLHLRASSLKERVWGPYQLATWLLYLFSTWLNNNGAEW